jgi:hypothetical protein
MTIHHHGDDSPYNGKEQDLQRACIRYLATHKKKPLFFHPPNGGFRSKVEASIFKGMGVRPGVADIIILEPRVPNFGLIVELKVKGGTLSDYQTAFLKGAADRGYYACVVWNLGAFTDLVNWYLRDYFTSQETWTVKL